MRILNLAEKEDLYQELAQIGVDEAAWEIFTAKNNSLAIKVEGLSVAAANILKQTALATGADCAVHRQVISGKTKTSAAILFASQRQMEEICRRLSLQPACVARLVPEIKTLLNNYFAPSSTITVSGKKVNLATRTHLMGIVNVTPDSFYDGGKFFAPEAAVAHAFRLIDEGADFIDIGAESTRPGSLPVPPKEQLRRLLPVLKAVAKKSRVPISVDTTSARVATAAIQEGATMINDISALSFDRRMARVCARAGVPVILMHIKGTPRTMQRKPVYQDLMGEIVSWLATAITRAIRSGIKKEQILIDPGIGFGKTTAHNLTIIRRLRELKSLGVPIVVGPSRKSFIGKLLGLPPEERLEGTIAAAVLAAENGASIIRVHDVRAVKRALTIHNAIKLLPALAALTEV